MKTDFKTDFKTWLSENKSNNENKGWVVYEISDPQLVKGLDKPFDSRLEAKKSIPHDEYSDWKAVTVKEYKEMFISEESSWENVTNETNQLFDLIKPILKDYEIKKSAENNIKIKTPNGLVASMTIDPMNKF